MDKELKKIAKLRLLGIIVCVLGFLTMPSGVGVFVAIAGIILLIISIKQQKKHDQVNKQEEIKPSLNEIWNDDEISVKCSFSCNGKPYEFYKERCGGGNYYTLDYFDTYGFKLNEICIKKDSSEAYLILSYNTPFNREEKTTQIPLLPSEEGTAKELAEILTAALKEHAISPQIRHSTIHRLKIFSRKAIIFLR